MDGLAKTPSQSLRPQINEQRRRKTTRALYKASVKELAIARTATTISDAIIQRIEKCLQRANHKTTPKLEAKAAFNRASRLMQQHNVSQAEVLARASSATQQEHAGQSVVSIRRADGSPRTVPRQEFAKHIAYAMGKFFDCKSYSSKKLASMEWTFYGIAENTVTAAMAFETAYNLTCEWARPFVGIARRNSYCLGVGTGLVRMAEEEMKAQEREAQHAESQRKARSGSEGPSWTAYDHEIRGNDIYETISDSGQQNDFGHNEDIQQGLQAKIRQFDNLNKPQSLWQSSAQVVAFRKSASTIADEYLQQNEVKVSRSRLKSAGIRDTLAYAQGKRDSREIDVRQGRIAG